MSWGGGTNIMSDMIRSFNKHQILGHVRHELYIDLIESLRGEDWHSCDECLGQDLVFDEVLDMMYLRWEEAYQQRYGEDA